MNTYELLIKAAEHAAASEHHTHCKARKGHPEKCTCHVQKARDALDAARKEAA